MSKDEGRRLPVTGLAVGTVPPAVLVCGDPERATKTAAYLDQATLASEQREYRSYYGKYRGVPVAVCSHGVGAPGAAIAFEELIAAGARRLIRIGTCGGLQPDVEDGHLVIATGAVDYTGFGRATVPPGYPPVADFRLTSALARQAAMSGHLHHTGLILTADNFYPGVETQRRPDYQLLSAANVIAVEMECAALFLVSSLRRVQAAAILAVDGNVLEKGESMEGYDPHREVVAAAVEAEIEIALKTFKSVEAGG
ncbi:MAG: nucleoside phosphorylase [Candidatus Promineifilaceae bacterium]|nr:nucleoside phosphorylase [Candidatus Promineifilaceae bacterium]